MYNRLPEVGFSGTKYVEDLKNYKLKYLFRKGAFRWFILCNCIAQYGGKKTQNNVNCFVVQTS